MSWQSKSPVWHGKVIRMMYKNPGESSLGWSDAVLENLCHLERSLSALPFVHCSGPPSLLYPLLRWTWGMRMVHPSRYAACFSGPMSTAHGLYFMKGVFCQDARLFKSQDRCTQRLPTRWTMTIIPVAIGRRLCSTLQWRMWYWNGWILLQHCCSIFAVLR